MTVKADLDELAGRAEMEAVLAAELETRAAWSTAYVNALPASAFACPDERTYPHHNSAGDVDLAHLRNALSRVAQDDTTSCGVAHLRAHAAREGVGNRSEEQGIPGDAPEPSEDNSQSRSRPRRIPPAGAGPGPRARRAPGRARRRPGPRRREARDRHAPRALGHPDRHPPGPRACSPAARSTTPSPTTSC